MNWLLYIDGLMVMLVMAFATWLLSVYLRDVSIVDSAWSLMILVASFTYSSTLPYMGLREFVIISLVTVWAIRLSIHLTWRNWGEKEDRRYQAIRAKYQPHFEIKSLLIIFFFQAILAWIISISLFSALSDEANYTITFTTLVIDSIAVILILIGLFYETAADWQLAKFKDNPGNHGKVMDKGLWKYSRHPNYFGECLIWWGFFFFALATGAWWSVISPIIMTWLLLKFSGVVMLEETITERRPEYSNYIKTTNAFFPGTTKKPDNISDSCYEGYTK